MSENDVIKQKTDYCLNCPTKPCSNGCPLGNDTAGFIKLAKEQKFYEAYKLLCNTTVLSSLCGLVCPHSKQCEGNCVRRFKSSPVEIGDIEAYIGKLAIQNDWKILDNLVKSTGKSVAIVGGGPAGLTCAAFLANAGVNVTIFEKHDELGGLFVYGIPDFRLNKNLVKDTISKIIELGVNVKLNMELGKDFSLNVLTDNFDAVFLSFGANIHCKMNVDGEETYGVFGGNEYLENKTRLELNGKTVIVCGGGNVAMDVSRTLKKQGAEKVFVVYRRSEKEMPAELNEIAEAKNEGVEFLFQNNIVKIIGETKVEAVELIKTELIQKEGDTRLSPVNISGSNYTILTDYVFMALGSKPEEKIILESGLETNKYGNIVIDENCRTSNPKVFAGGDISTYKKTGTVAWAARSGRDASLNILKFLGI